MESQPAALAQPCCLSFLAAQPAAPQQAGREQRARVRSTLAASIYLCLLCAASAALDSGRLSRQQREELVAAHLERATVDLDALMHAGRRDPTKGRRADGSSSSELSLGQIETAAAAAGAAAEARPAGRRLLNSTDARDSSSDSSGGGGDRAGGGGSSSDGSGGGSSSGVGDPEDEAGQQYDADAEDGSEDSRVAWMRQGVHSRRQHPWPGPSGYLAMCVVVRDSGLDLLEWIEYHRWVGVAQLLAAPAVV
jgi:hypothetical protein